MTSRMHVAGGVRAAVGAFGGSLIGASLFGPQSQWSSLLSEREHVQLEIKRGTQYLEQLRKDLAGRRLIPQAWLADEPACADGLQLSSGRLASTNDVTEQCLLDWLERLDERLGVVSKEIESLQADNGSEKFDPEESVFELLRAAG